VNVTGALTANSVGTSSGISLATVSQQITSVASFTNGQVSILETVDATNAKVSQQAGTTTVTTTVGKVAGSTSATGAFLDFFRRLFGGGN